MRIINSPPIPLQLDDIDTDVIIPATHLTTTAKKGLGRFVFEQVRKMDLLFPFNLSKYQEAQILLAGKNFGCGSSREHAVWALRDWGIRAIIAKSFSDIFYNNALKNMVVPIVLPEKIIDQIFNDEKGGGKYHIAVDIENLCVTLPDGLKHPFELDPYRRECLLNEMDDLDFLITQLKLIRAFKKKQHLYFQLNSWIPNRSNK